MFDADAPPAAPESTPRSTPAAARFQRVDARAEVAFGRVDGALRLRRLHQSGSAKCQLPRVYAEAPEAVFLNTAGGLTGGDRIAFECVVEDGAALCATTQAAERIYRSADGDAIAHNRLTIGRGAQLEWLPQETILFDGARFRRRLEVNMAADAALLAVETLVLGREAMGETFASGFVSDEWRIRREGVLVHADTLRLASPLEQARSERAAAGGMRAVATLLYVAPDAEARLDPARAVLARQCAEGVEHGASAWNGLLAVRMLAPRGQSARDSLTAFLTEFRGAPPPRVWSL